MTAEKNRLNGANMTDRTTGWPPKRRAEYAARIKKMRIWLRSTGPRTSEGKARCARNAAKLSPEWQLVRLALLAQRQFLHQIKQIHKVLSISNVLPDDPKKRNRLFYWWCGYELMTGDLRAFGDFIEYAE
jgi:hypothetical protein